MRLSTSRYVLTDCALPPGLRISERKGSLDVVIDAQAGEGLLTHAEKLSGMPMPPSVTDKALNWLIESYL